MGTHKKTKVQWDHILCKSFPKISKTGLALIVWDSDSGRPTTAISDGPSRILKLVFFNWHLLISIGQMCKIGKILKSYWSTGHEGRRLSVLWLVCAWQSLIIFRHDFVWGATSEWQSRFSWSTWYWSRWRHYFISDILVSFFIRCAIFCVDISAIIRNISSICFWFWSVLILRFTINKAVFAIFLWCLRRFYIGLLILAKFT